MSNDILVFVELQNGDIRKVTPQLVSAARPLAEARGGKLHALLVGEGIGELARKAATLGVDSVAVVEDPSLADYTAEAYTEAITRASKHLGAGALLFGNTSIGKDIAPRVAQRLGVGMISDVTGTISTSGNPIFKRPVYAGKAVTHVEVLESSFVISVRANSYPSAPAAASPAPIQSLAVAPDPSKIRTKVKEVVVRAAGKVDLTEADIIVSGGMGVKGPEGFEFLRP
ncbi:MAG: electron transfer flavoprotein subunit alpha/FixB family protein, partial [Candidatus Omnitrophica bacterium]|nr:electron transfer flavoprotein subunit alpha/FixB family protein [Candidatus Omnitrophota bacterium]